MDMKQTGKDTQKSENNVRSNAPEIETMPLVDESVKDVSRLIPNPRNMSPNAVLNLQRTIGNRAVQRLLVQRDPKKAEPRPVGQLDAAEQAFMNKTSEASSAVALAAGKYKSWLSSLTIPYALAWTAHKNTLTAASQAAKDANAIVLGTVLAFAPGGAGGLVGDAMKKLTASGMMVDAVKDLAKYGLREGGRALGGGGTGGADPAGASDGGAPTSGGSGLEKMPPDPLVWQNYTDKRTQDEVLNPVRQKILDWQHKVNNHDEKFDYNFDPVAAVRGALKLWSGTSLFELQDIPQQETALAYERGFLADWITTEAAKVFMQHSQFSFGKIQKKIVNYGKSIGFNDVEAFLSQHVNAGVAENNERARKAGRGLI